MTGLGDRIICLGAAWRYARLTGRTLIADWRHGAYGLPNAANRFAACFEPAPLLAGVPFVGNYGLGRPPLPRPRYPPAWDDDRPVIWPYLRDDATVLADRDEAVALIRAGEDVAAPTVVLDACVNDGLVAFEEARTFLQGLRPVAPVAAAVETFASAHLRDGPVIGLHVRHGNGGVTGHARYWESFAAAIGRCVRAVEAARAALGRGAPVLLCTDSEPVEQVLRARLDAVLVRDKPFRAVGQGELHLGPWGPGSLRDALIEMLLLAECQALIRFPPGSFFSFPAAVLKRTHRSVPKTLYDLQAPLDESDPLAAALLL